MSNFPRQLRRSRHYAPLCATCGPERNSKRLWKSVENLDDLHAAEMVQIARCARNDKISVDRA
jgi:hypothetical protein